MGRIDDIPQPSITRADGDGFHVECPTCLTWITVPLVEREVETGGYHAEPDMAPYETHHIEAHTSANTDE
jgi:hypothetical protein